MATATPQPPPTPPAHHVPQEILIVSHSSLFYWWPVWAVGFLMAIMSMPLFTGESVATVPSGTKHFSAASGSVTDAKGVGQIIKEADVLVGPETVKKKETDKGTAYPIELTRVHISTSKNLGVAFVIIMLVVIFITNVPLRGLWSVIVIIFLVSLLIILGLLHVLGELVDWFRFLDIRITTGGYVIISTVLFALWLAIFFMFDRQIYMVFTPGQLRVKLEIGDAETAYDTTGMTIQKQRSDIFRHWILGLGSGDLIVRTAGAQGHQFDMPNVLFLGRKVREIEDMLRSRQVVSG